MSSAREERERLLRVLSAAMRKHHDAGQPEIVRALRDVRDEVRGADHRPPRQISTLPAEEQDAALERVETIRKRHQSAGTEPVAVPKGAQRT